MKSIQDLLGYYDAHILPIKPGMLENHPFPDGLLVDCLLKLEFSLSGSINLLKLSGAVTYHINGLDQPT